jgi:hypothetical protein
MAVLLSVSGVAPIQIEARAQDREIDKKPEVSKPPSGFDSSGRHVTPDEIEKAWRRPPEPPLLKIPTSDWIIFDTKSSDQLKLPESWSYEIFSRQLVDEHVMLASHTEGWDLTPFYEVNQRVLRDLGVQWYDSPMKPAALNGISTSDASVMTGSTPSSQNVGLPLKQDEPHRGAKAVSVASLEDGTEVITVFDVRHPQQDGKAYTVTQKDRNAVQDLKTELSGATRIYHYGPKPTLFDLDSFVREQGTEKVRRSEYTARDLHKLEQNLREIETRTLRPDTTTLLNGLPPDKPSAANLGKFAGDPNAWVKFHDDVDGLLFGTALTTPITSKEFNHELANGFADVVIVVAHANGVRIFLKDKSVTLNDIDQLPNRTDLPHRPRVAVLVSCDAGAEMKTSSWFSKEKTPNFADVLLKKGFFDVAIAPAHKIRRGEAMQVLQQLRNGLQMRDLPPGWDKVSLNFRLRFQGEGDGVPISS